MFISVISFVQSSVTLFHASTNSKEFYKFLYLSKMLQSGSGYFLSNAGTNQLTTNRSCCPYGRPLRTCSPRRTQGSRTWPSWAMYRLVSEGSAGKICSNSWTTSVNRLSLKICRRNRMVVYQKKNQEITVTSLATVSQWKMISYVLVQLLHCLNSGRHWLWS